MPFGVTMVLWDQPLAESLLPRLDAMRLGL